jgi:hypothetical protein
MRQLRPPTSSEQTARFAMDLLLLGGKVRVPIKKADWGLGWCTERTRGRVCGARSNQLYLPKYKLKCVDVEIESAQAERGCCWHS